MVYRNYYILFDLEATCEEGSKFQEDQSQVESNKEVIELGAVKITPEYDILDSFTSLVKPKINSILSPFCERLTGIESSEIEQARGFSEVYSEFAAWSGQPLLWMSWSDDYTLLNKDCESNGVSCFSKKRFFDARDVVKLLRGRSANGLDKEIKNYDIVTAGLQRHRALDDSIITAKLLKELNLRNKGWKV